jgi:hypothetical protein
MRFVASAMVYKFVEAINKKDAPNNDMPQSEAQALDASREIKRNLKTPVKTRTLRLSSQETRRKLRRSFAMQWPWQICQWRSQAMGSWVDIQGRDCGMA